MFRFSLQSTGLRSSALISLTDANGLIFKQDIRRTDQRRGFQLFEIFSKEAQKKRKQRLREDLQKGAFDDFKELKDTGGKLWHGSFKLLPQSVATLFPSIQVSPAIGGKAQFPPPKEIAPGATLVCTGFKAGSEEMLASWSRPFRQAFAELPPDRGSVHLIELSIVESRVMSVWPFRAMVMRASKVAAIAQAQRPLPPQPEHASTPGCIASGTGHTTQVIKDPVSARQSKQYTVNPNAEGAPRPGKFPGTSKDDWFAVQQHEGAAGSGRVAGGLWREDLFFFGDPYDVCKALGITNRLTGYIFLLDRNGRVRFRGCGHATAKETAALLLATEQLSPAVKCCNIRNPKPY